MEQEEAGASRMGVFGGQFIDGVLGIGQQVAVALVDLMIAVGPVGRNGEVDEALRVGQVMHFQVADRLVHPVARGDENRHDDERACRFRHPALVGITHQSRRRFEECHQRVEQTGRGLARRNGGQQGQHDHAAQPQTRIAENDGPYGNDQQRDENDRPGDGEPAELAIGALEATLPRYIGPDDRLELLPPGGDEIVADVAAFLIGLVGGAAGHFHFRQLRLPRQFLDRVAVAVLRVEIEGCVVGAFGQQPVHQRDAGKPFQPVDVVQPAQGLNDRPDPHIARRQPVLLDDLHFQPVEAPVVQRLFQPVDDGGHADRRPAQAVEHLGGESVVGHQRPVALDDGQTFVLVFRFQNRIGHAVGLGAHRAGVLDGFRHPLQFLHQHETQEGGQSPQFADL